MNQKKPGFIKLVRAPFLSSIISPLITGSLLALYITNNFEVVNFVLVLILGISLHIATNVYNDIYDTIQGTDKINAHRNEFSGGSGVLVDYPQLMPTMFRIARIALVVACFAGVFLFFMIDISLRLYLIGLFLLSAFFSKYYTAAPVKVAYRGIGEISVWFAFGPMAIFVAAVSQNVGMHPIILAAMPITGISTLSILLIGQIIDKDADQATGKWGVAVRLGIKPTRFIYMTIQLILCLNIIILASVMMNNGWPVLIALIPYAIMLPGIIKQLQQKEKQLDSFKKAAGLNALLHLYFSLLFSMGVGMTIFLK
jgi:1,4-dihydroxy-2-naphthoate octaprenyltransferase